MADKVRVGGWYKFNPISASDATNPRPLLVAGDTVQVVNKFGCPPANTMGQCYVKKDGLFAGMVSVISLTPTRKPKEKAANFRSFAKAWNATTAYNAENKVAFHRECLAMLKALANEMGLKKGEYDLRSNKGGIAVSGEITLHTDRVYIQLSQGSLSYELFMYRSCNGRKDYCGARNQWLNYKCFDDLPRLAKMMRAV